MLNLVELEKKRFLKHLPLISSLLLILASTLLPAPKGYVLNVPMIPLLCLIGWSLTINSKLSMYEVFFIGIFSDLCFGTALGSTALLFLLCSFLLRVIYIRFDLNHFYKNLLASLVVIIFYYLLTFLFITIYYKTIPSTDYILFNILITGSSYPCFYVLFLWIFRSFKLDKAYEET